MAEEKLIYRLTPCPARDIDAMEAWLEDMAAQGLFLTKDGFFCGFGIFRKDTPRPCRYRLVPAAKRPTLWSDDNGAPSEESQALWKRYGWEYLTYRADFHIYCTTDPLTSMPPYDRETREQALAVLTKRYRGSIFSGVSTGLVFSMLLDGNFLRAVLYLGTWRSLFILAVLASFVMTSVFTAVHYRRLRQRLTEGDSLRRERTDWKRRQLRHRLLSGTQMAAAIAAVAMPLTLWAASTEEGFLTPLADYPGTPPFATLADLAPEGSRFVRDTSGFLETNTYREWSDPLAPRIMEWCETGDFHGLSADGSSYAYMDITYYETISPVLAQLLAQEYWWEHWFLNRKYEEIPLPAPDTLGLDSARAYIGRHGMTHIVLQKGGVLCHVYGFRGGMASLTVPELAAAMAASLQ